MRKIDLTKGALSYLLGYTILPDLNAGGKPFPILKVVPVFEVQVLDLGLSSLLHAILTIISMPARIYLWRATRRPTFAASS